MNWYKLKLSSPVMEKPPYSNYFNIGHTIDEPVIVWFIDGNFNFSAKSDKYLTHIGWNKYLDAKEDAGILARGRYEVNKGITSAYLHKNKLNDRQMEYVKKRIEQILDKKLNNPTIMFLGI